MADDKDDVQPSARPQREPLPNTTFAERAAARSPRSKAVQADEDQAENKAVGPKKATRKSKS